MNEIYKAAYITDITGKEYLVAYTCSVSPESFTESFKKFRSDLTFKPQIPRVEVVRPTFGGLK